MREFAKLPDFTTRQDEDVAEARTFRPFSEALKHWNSGRPRQGSSLAEPPAGLGAERVAQSLKLVIC